MRRENVRHLVAVPAMCERIITPYESRRLHQLVSFKLLQLDWTEARSANVVLRRSRQVTATAQQPPRNIEQSLNRANDVEFTRRFHVLEEKQLAALHRTHDNKLHISYNLSYQRLDDTLALTDNWFTGSRYDRCIINSEKCRFSTNKPFDFWNDRRNAYCYSGRPIGSRI